MINGLVLLYSVLFHNLGVAIIAFTVILRVLMIPLTLRQSKQMKKMSAIQPRLREIQTKFKDDRARMSQETMKAYKESGVSPAGCLGPMIIQLPLFIAFYSVLRAALPSTPERLADLSKHLYPWLQAVSDAIPINGRFLWMDLGQLASAGTFPFFLPVLVGVSTWLMQKVSTMPASNPQQEQTNRTMLWIMPGMFAVFSLNFEKGLALYWIVSNIAGMIIQGFITGWGPLINTFKGFGRKRQPADAAPANAIAPAASKTAKPPTEEAQADEDNRENGKDGGGSDRAGAQGARRRTHGSRNRRH
ncbi:MAG: YidC/Oxa1 family membrane protein insertase [SAR202 cluster bacterium]|nr:YidC/Oxa1 family membrane protein insertase [SAR202 cluster bacterium]